MKSCTHAVCRKVKPDYSRKGDELIVKIGTLRCYIGLPRSMAMPPSVACQAGRRAYWTVENEGDTI